MTPTQPSERYAAIDVLRGIALLGVLLINLLTLFRVSLFEYILSTDRDAVSRILDAVFEFKSMDLFCMCFGAGIAIQAERTKSAGFLLRRFSVLLVMGLIHLFLIWNGDILTLYAICGFAMVLLIRLPAGWLGAAGFVLILASIRGWISSPGPAEAAMRSQGALAAQVYPVAGFLQILQFRYQETLHFILPLLLWVLPKSLGLMLAGAAVWKAGVIRHPRDFRGILLVVAAIGLISGVQFESDVPLAFAYGALILLCADYLALFAPLGRMALTNYLAQSLILTTLFYGYGFGLFGRISSGAGVMISLSIYAAQLLFSHAWLRRFQFGPTEWLWRSLTYGCRQPFRLAADRASKATVV